MRERKTPRRDEAPARPLGGSRPASDQADRRVIDAATLAAYRETEYRVFGASPMVLRVGVRSPQLAQQHAAHGTSCSAFITACNPRGLQRGADENETAQRELARVLSKQGRAVIEGEGVHPTNGWPREASYWVPGLEREAAQQLGRQFGQNAIIWAGSDAVPELLLLR